MGGPNKRESLKNVIDQKWQPVITNYMCPKQLLIVEKHQYNFSCSLHLYIKQNKTFLITNLSNVNSKICLRNQTRLCIYLVYSYLCSPTKNPKIKKWGRGGDYYLEPESNKSLPRIVYGTFHCRTFIVELV